MTIPDRYRQPIAVALTAIVAVLLLVIGDFTDPIEGDPTPTTTSTTTTEPPATTTTTPTPTTTSTTAPETPEAMPTPSTTGVDPDLTLSSLDAGAIRPGGTYERVRISGANIRLSGGDPVRLTDCQIDGSILTSTEIHLTRCTVNGGIYPTGSGGSLTDVLVNGRGQAFRPLVSDGYWGGQGDRFAPMPWTVTDTYLRVPPGGPGAHVEASQIAGGSGYVFRNTVFEVGCPFNNTQTAAMTVHASDSLFEDSWFVGCGGFAIYSDGPGVRFVRPRIGPDHRWGLLYQAPGRTDPQIIEPIFLGRP